MVKDGLIGALAGVAMSCLVDAFKAGSPSILTENGWKYASIGQECFNWGSFNSMFFQPDFLAPDAKWPNGQWTAGPTEGRIYGDVASMFLQLLTTAAGVIGDCLMHPKNDTTAKALAKEGLTNAMSIIGGTILSVGVDVIAGKSIWNRYLAPDAAKEIVNDIAILTPAKAITGQFAASIADFVVDQLWKEFKIS